MNEQLDAWLKLQTNQVKQNVDVVDRKENDGPLLHISPDDSITNFIPRLPENRSSQDNVTVPRLCVSRDIAGAIVGHGHVHWDAAMNCIYSYYIYAFDWESALVPNHKVAGIQSKSIGSELWLVPYDKDHVYIKGKVIGRIHLTSVVNLPPVGSATGDNFVLNGVVKCNRDTDFLYSKSDPILFEAGAAYKFSFNPDKQKYGKYDEESLIVESISAGDYASMISAKKISLAKMKL